MKATVISAAEMTRDLVDRWNQIQRAEPSLDSPYFRPEYVQLVADCGKRVEVAVLEQDGQIAGFFPFERTSRRVAGPVGTPLTDFQGFVLPGHVEVDPQQLLRQCGLKAWNFDHLLVSQISLSRWRWRSEPSPWMDLSAGYDDWCRRQRSGGSQFIPQAVRKRRKLDREMGSVRFDPARDDLKLLQILIRWKREQCRRTKVRDPFDVTWTCEFLEKALACQDERFSSGLMVLYAGDRPVAIDLCLRSAGVLHSLVCAYDSDFHRYSPGRILMLEVAAAAQSLGITRIDLGKGPEEYKYRLMSGATQVAEGAIDLRTLVASARQGWHRMRYRVIESRFRTPVRAVARTSAKVFPPLRNWLSLR